VIFDKNPQARLRAAMFYLLNMRRTDRNDYFTADSLR